jgi:hypothetical protein
MARPAKRLVVALAGLPLLLADRPARAQLHGDFGVSAGPMRRVLGARAAGEPDAAFGLAVEGHAHLAIIPLLRAGVYVGHDSSPQGDRPGRSFWTFGARAKFTPPLPIASLRAWAYGGFGYALGYAPSYHTTVPLLGGSTTNALVDGASGGFFEIPFGIGAGYKLLGPFWLTLEVGGRFVVGQNGQLYSDDGRTAQPANQPPTFFGNPGTDVFAASALLGLSFEL